MIAGDNTCVCVVDAYTLLLLSIIYLFFPFSDSTFPPKFVPAAPLWRQARSTRNFDAVWKIVPVRVPRFFSEIRLEVKKNAAVFTTTSQSAGVDQPPPTLGHEVTAATMQQCSLHNAVACTPARPKPADTWERSHQGLEKN